METSRTFNLVESEWKAGPVPIDTAAECWPILRPFVVRACERSGNRFTPEGCMERFISGAWMMWACNSPENECCGVMFTQINVYEDTGLRVMELVLMGGKRIHEWMHLEPTLLNHALDNNCDRVEAWTRDGFNKLLPDWRRSVVMERELR